MAVILNFVDASREDARATAEENAWNEFLRKTEAMVEAQKAMHEAHKVYLAIKYPKGVARA